MADYWELYKKVKLFFQENKEVFCPSINEYVVFTRKGLRHILQKHHTQRYIPDQIRRFRLLLSIRNTLEEQGLVMDEKNGFTALSLVLSQKTIRVVTVRNIVGKLRFISIMEHRTRKAQ
jgi:hypothetical protein